MPRLPRDAQRGQDTAAEQFSCIWSSPEGWISVRNSARGMCCFLNLNSYSRKSPVVVTTMLGEKKATQDIFICRRILLVAFSTV